MATSPITAFDVEALVDSQLGWEEEKRVRRGIDSDPAMQAYYLQITHQKKLIVAWWENEDETIPGAARLS